VRAPQIEHTTETTPPQAERFREPGGVGSRAGEPHRPPPASSRQPRHPFPGPSPWLCSTIASSRGGSPFPPPRGALAAADDNIDDLGWQTARQTGSHRTLRRDGWPDVVFAFHDRDEIGPRMLARLARRTGLRPEDF